MGTFMSKFSKASARFTKAGESNLHNNGTDKKKGKDDFIYRSDVDEVIVGRPTKEGGETAFTGYGYGDTQKEIGSEVTSRPKAYSSTGETISGNVIANTTKTPGDIKTGPQYNKVKGYVTRPQTEKEKSSMIEEMKRLNAKG